MFNVLQNLSSYEKVYGKAKSTACPPRQEAHSTSQAWPSYRQGPWVSSLTADL